MKLSLLTRAVVLLNKAALGLVILLQAKKRDVRPATTCARIASCVLTRDRGLKEVGSRKK